MTPTELLTATVREVVATTPRARILRLDLGRQPFAFEPGQAVLAGPLGGDRRPYSIASAPEEVQRNGWLELLVSANTHLPLTAGAAVELEGPLGSFTFPPSPDERRFIFIAGGTGIAPLRAMLRHALEIPHDHIGLFYSARRPDDFPYEEEFRDLAGQRRIELRQTVTREADETWSGARGRLDREQLKSLVHDAATLCFVCGPSTLVAEITALLGELGISEARIRIERWAS